MSLTGAVNSAVSAMKAQSAALSIVSYNLANVSTTGFKASSSNFASLLTSASGETVSGGVTVTSKSNVTATGLLSSTDSATDLAIDGDGFFCVQTADTDSEVCYTRNGNFEVDTDGYLKNGDYYLLGWPTDTDGNVIGSSTTGNLEKIDTNAYASYAAATTTLDMAGNLPANAETGTSYTSDAIEVYDSLGTSMTLTATWTKAADNSWTVSFSDPLLSSDNATSAGTVTSSSITLTFNDDGSLASTDPDPATLTVGSLSTGAADLSIDLDFGADDSSDMMTQLSDDDGTLSASITPTADGYAYGTYTGATIEEDGTVKASYSNGASIAIYKVPVATFANPDGLTELSGSIYGASLDSSSATLHTAGTDGTGYIDDYTLESSTTDTNTEFSSMMSAQQAYSAASQVFSTANSMFDTLMQAIR
jgi:flagellar hook protein FlgE